MIGLRKEYPSFGLRNSLPFLSCTVLRCSQANGLHNSVHCSLLPLNCAEITMLPIETLMIRLSQRCCIFNFSHFLINSANKICTQWNPLCSLAISHPPATKVSLHYKRADKICLLPASLPQWERHLDAPLPNYLVT